MGWSPWWASPRKGRIIVDKIDEAYKRRQAACQCIPRDRRIDIQTAMDFASDFSDGAFMAYMEEQGIDVSELEVFSVEHDCMKEDKNV